MLDRIDDDLPALTAELRGALGDIEPSPLGVVRSVDELHAAMAALQRAAEAVLARTDTSLEADAEVESLLTDASAAVLRLNAQRLRTKRAMVRLLAEPGTDADKHGEVDAVRSRYHALLVQLDGLDELLVRLRERLQTIRAC